MKSCLKCYCYYALYMRLQLQGHGLKSVIHVSIFNKNLKYVHIKFFLACQDVKQQFINIFVLKQPVTAK